MHAYMFSSINMKEHNSGGVRMKCIFAGRLVSVCTKNRDEAVERRAIDREKTRQRKEIREIK